MSKSSSASPRAPSCVLSRLVGVPRSAADTSSAHEQGAGTPLKDNRGPGGRVGVCVGHQGPGATNLVTRSPMPDGQHAPHRRHRPGVTAVLGKDGFPREIDITGITMPITQAQNTLVKQIDELPYVFRKPSTWPAPVGLAPCFVDVARMYSKARSVPNWDCHHLPPSGPLMRFTTIPFWKP